MGNPKYTGFDYCYKELEKFDHFFTLQPRIIEWSSGVRNL